MMSGFTAARRHCRRFLCFVLTVNILCCLLVPGTCAAKTSRSSKERVLLDLLDRLIDNERTSDKLPSSRRREQRIWGSQHGRLLSHQYKDGPSSSVCPGAVDVSGTTGQIQSPGNDQRRYPNNVRCGWRLTAPPGKVLQVSFQYFSIEGSRNCENDALELLDGMDPQTSSALGKFCGNVVPTPMTSTGQSMIIVFLTNGAVNEGGFVINWKSINPILLAAPPSNANPCNSILELRQSSGIIRIPLDDTATSYPPNVVCQWRVLAAKRQNVQITFNKFDLELSDDCLNDYVSVYDGADNTAPLIGKYCGPRLPQERIQSSGSVLFIQFEADDQVDGEPAYSGLNLSWTSGPSSSNTILSSENNCGNPFYKPTVSLSSRIVNGEVALPNSWPWQCSIKYKFTSPPWGQWCGAIVINNNQNVLTAAHCLFDDKKNVIDLSYLQVVCGDFNQSVTTDPKRQTLPVSGFVIHERYNPRANDYDIAVLQLQGRLTFNNVVSPVCLGQMNEAEGSQCVVTGWGDTRGTGDKSVLQQLVVPIISQTRCSQEDVYDTLISDNMLCAGYLQGGKDACGGDSGGPLVCPTGSRWFLQGIVSFGQDCARVNKPGIYCRITRYRSWIADKTGVTV